MATTIYVQRRFVVLLAILAMLAASLIVTVRPVRAAIEDQCSGESEIVDVGSYYIVKGTKGSDWIDCSASDKAVILQGGKGDDYLWGSDYSDVIQGGWGDDWLFGLGGDDWLLGGHDDDYMDGGADTDTCLGGRGFDSFGGGGCETQDWGREP